VYLAEVITKDRGWKRTAEYGPMNEQTSDARSKPPVQNSQDKNTQQKGHYLSFRFLVEDCKTCSSSSTSLHTLKGQLFFILRLIYIEITTIIRNAYKTLVRTRSSGKN
jgi:hypothetical protein